MDSPDLVPVSDEDRRRAEAKKLVLAPLHDAVAPDEESASVSVSRHINAAPAGNIATDREDSSSLVGFSKTLDRTPAVKKDRPSAKDPKSFKFTPEGIVMTAFVATNIAATALYIIV